MAYPQQETVSRLLAAVRDGDRDALNDLFPLVYEELRVRAHRQRQHWHGNHTINTTALVHEAYLKLVDGSQTPWQSRAHFLAVAAKAMRHILIDYAKQQQRLKRGGDHTLVPLDTLNGRHMAFGSMSEDQAVSLVSLDVALQRLEHLNQRQCRVVECRFFGGMTIPDTAVALDVSPATVKRDWRLAQAWLYREMHPTP